MLKTYILIPITGSNIGQLEGHELYCILPASDGQKRQGKQLTKVFFSQPHPSIALHRLAKFLLIS